MEKRGFLTRQEHDLRTSTEVNVQTIACAFGGKG